MVQDQSFMIGVDYGTDSVRSVILNAASGDEISSSVFYYPRWKDGLYCDASVNDVRDKLIKWICGHVHC